MVQAEDPPGDLTMPVRRPRTPWPRLEWLEDRCTPTAGLLDPTFGSGGIATTAIGSHGAQAAAVAVQPDGKIVAVGYARNLSKGVVAGDFTVARYASTGALDAGFGNGGVVTTPLSKNSDAAHAVIVQPDGKVLAGGYANLDTSPYISNQNVAFALVRYNANGTLDTTFGGVRKGTGKVTTEVAPGAVQEIINGLALQSDGKIVAVGLSQGNIAIVRYNANGTLDTSFDGDGKRVLDLGGFEQANGVALQPDGKILVTGRTTAVNASYDALVARFNPDGSLDASFGSGGVVITDIVQAGAGSRQNEGHSIGSRAAGSSWPDTSPKRWRRRHVAGALPAARLHPGGQPRPHVRRRSRRRRSPRRLHRFRPGRVRRHPAAGDRRLDGQDPRRRRGVLPRPDHRPQRLALRRRPGAPQRGRDARPGLRHRRRDADGRRREGGRGRRGRAAGGREGRGGGLLR